MSSGDSSGYQTERKPGHTGGRDKAPLLGGSSRAFVSYCFGRTTLCSWGSPGQFAIFFAADTDFED